MSVAERLRRLRQEEQDGSDGIKTETLQPPHVWDPQSEEEQYHRLKYRLLDAILQEIAPSMVATRNEEALRAEVSRLLNELAERHTITLFQADRVRLVDDLIDELLHFGPLQRLLTDPGVARIVVNGPMHVEVERRDGAPSPYVRFQDEEHLMGVCRRMAAALKAKVDQATPLVERRLRDGSHVRIVVPPLARRGATVRIDKGERNPFEVLVEEEKRRDQAREEPFFRLRRLIIERVITESEGADAAFFQQEENLRRQIETAMEDVLREEAEALARSERENLFREVFNEITGLGPIQGLVEDPSVTEIMVNGPYQVYIERGGRLTLSDVRFRDNEHVLQIIERIVSPLGRRIDETSPMVDARLKDGSRINAIIPPLSIVGPCLTIRKFATDPFTVADLIQFGTLTPEVAQFLEAAVYARMNIIVSGGTGSGKTTLLNVLSSFIPPGERIITIEDAAELQLRQDHVISLEARPPNIEGSGEVTIRDLVRNALRMRPDRIVVGECRGGEALDMLQAMNTGHDGSLTTAHANNPRELLARLETMVLMAGVELPVKAIREQIEGAIDLIVHISRFRDGTRKVNYVTEIVGMEGNVINLQDIFLYEQTGISADGETIGTLRPTGILPRCYDRILQSGSILPSTLFET